MDMLAPTVAAVLSLTIMSFKAGKGALLTKCISLAIKKQTPKATRAHCFYKFILKAFDGMARSYDSSILQRRDCGLPFLRTSWCFKSNASPQLSRWNFLLAPLGGTVDSVCL